MNKCIEANKFLRNTSVWDSKICYIKFWIEPFFHNDFTCTYHDEGGKQKNNNVTEKCIFELRNVMLKPTKYCYIIIKAYLNVYQEKTNVCVSVRMCAWCFRKKCKNLNKKFREKILNTFDCKDSTNHHSFFCYTQLQFICSTFLFVVIHEN